MSSSEDIANGAQPALKIATQVVCVEGGGRDPYNPSSVPIYQTATFKQTSAVSCGEYDYTRSGNPTRTVLENHLAKIMGAHKAFCVSSGMAALDVILRLLRSGDEVIAGTDLYGGTNRLLKFLESQKIATRHVNTCQLDEVEAALTGSTRMVLLESPTNPLIQVCDIAAISDLVHAHNPDIIVVVDNTMLSPCLQRPLSLGADIDYQSATKYLCGHHDIMAGVIGCKSQALAEALYFVINASGVGLAPFDSWLLLRGVKTLAVRMEKQQRNAMAIAEFLHAKGLQVNFPGLPDHPSYELNRNQASGPGAVLSVVTGSTLVSQQLVEACKVFSISVSFGCVNSLISMPCRMSHASIPAHVRKERNMPEDLIRLCVGIEDTDDLIADLEQAMEAANLL